MSMLQEFKQFAMRGNVIDVAVGIVIGVAFGKIVSSLVADIIMPPIGKLMGGVDFSNLFIALGGGNFGTLAAAQKAPPPSTMACSSTRCWNSSSSPSRCFCSSRP